MRIKTLGRSNLALIGVILAVIPAAGPAAAAMQTPFEAGGGTTTPTYGQTMDWLDELAESSPLITLDSFGTSPQGRALPVVIADRDGRSAPVDDGRLVLLVQACIHAGESCGKDAGMILLRDLAADPALAGRLLGEVTLVFIPIFNVDGHERFGPFNRANQNGPEMMGWRTNARNLNLNRDYLKADTPEMQAWLGLWNRWSPDFFIDIHSTDGADYQYGITYALETHGNLEAGLTDLVLDYEAEMNRAMASDGRPMFRYVAFKDWHDPDSGLRAWAATPRFSQGYAAIRNRPGLLIETHMLKPYADRVESAGLLVRHTLEWLNREAGRVREAVARADEATAAASFRDDPLPLSFELAEESRVIDFLGVGYHKVQSEVTGGAWNRFDGPAQTMKMEMFDSLVPKDTVDLPAAYVVPAEWPDAIERLAWHGVALDTLRAPVELEVRTYRFFDPKWNARPYEGRQTVEFDLEEGTETLAFGAGSVVVRMDQPAARAAAHLLEPQGPDSLARWGFFNAVFDRVEYIEAYVIEPMIAEMLAADPGLKGELEVAKAADPQWAASPWNIRDWFYRRTPYYDRRAGLYPVGMIDEEEALAGLPVGK